MMQIEHVKYMNTPASQCNNMRVDDAHNLHNTTINHEKNSPRKAMMKISTE